MSQQIIAGPTGSNTPGQQRLTTALANFLTQLDPADQTTLNQISQPDVTAVTQFCAKFDSDSNLRRKRLGEKLQPFLLFIQSLGDVIGVYIQSDPTIAAHVWGTVKLVLQISSNYFDYFIKISDMIVKLQHHCPRIERIGKLFQNSQKLQDAILGFYAIIVEFCLKQFVKSIWKPFKVQFADLEGQLEEQRHMIDDEVLIASELAAHQAAQCTLIYQNRGYTHREFEVNQWTRNKEWQLKQDLAAKKRKLSRILERISGLDHRRSFSNARGRRHPETGKWFFQLPEFKNWDAALDSSALWYNGIPGSGKSILATSVIEHLYTLHKNKKTSIIYFFCDFHTPETLRYRNILSSLLKQAVILNTTLSNQAQAELETSYLDSQFLPDAYKIEAFFSQFAQKLGTLYILIDGIDECPEEERLDLIAFLKRFLARNLQQTKFILSSRPDIEIPRALPISYRISISSAASRPDLEAYISHELESKCPNLEVYSPQINQDIKQALLKGANGMFLWVYFQIQDIRRAGNKDKIYHLLSDLPRGLHETYARILHRIQEERDEDEAVMVFNWLSKCRRPLTLPELRDAIAIRIGDTRHDQIRKLRLLEPICRFTLEMVLGNQHQPDIGHATELVRPFHATTGPSVEAQAQPRFPCLNYVTEYWLHHFGDGSASELTSRAQHLETLLDELNLPFPYMPRIKGLEKPDANDLLLWACENDNAPLFAVLFFKSRPPLQATLLLSAHGFRAINIPKDATGDVGMVLSYAIQRSSLEVLRYILEDPPITFRTGIRSIRGTLNLALNEENPTELIYYHVAHKIYGTNCYQGSENYLLSMAARIGHLEVFNILLKVHLAVMPSGLGIKANKHLLLLRQAIDGGNNHIFKALFCTPGIRDTKAFRLSFALAVGRMNQELIRYLVGDRDTFLAYLKIQDCWSCFADDIWPANHAGLELPRIRGRAALTAEALAHFDLADDNPILIARARGYRGTVRLILKELSKLCNELVDITGRCNRMLSCISLEFLREAIIRGDIGYLELWENRVTEDDLRQLCPCKRYTLDLMHEAIRHKQIASVIWLFKVQHYTRSQVEEYKENALKCSDQDIIDFLETKWLETEN
ncbi:hypothetical protein AOL_s00210g343 [Orbilia oligospora ATCC 24927]|uniref:NACHT domain-containing protein n=1 Tax=Arthrobotrys oligospora (strain ATCC 24927 / CBS 115.81 / DSM 1491) TaxID=756982 RepID=G1XSI4_ARTOA|nr:hypothetical protein AOL_s00210g343 [Orbilia oligospora ATCC 24927]EGX43896.1 hypothetical protein AOL_s00210g343 [Orbilia oligospora ATCC 24927]